MDKGIVNIKAEVGKKGLSLVIITVVLLIFSANMLAT